MESERGIIIIGHCRQGKCVMMQQLLKERPVLIGVDFGDIDSAVLSLNMSLGKVPIVSKEVFQNLQLALEEVGATFRDSTMYINEDKGLFEEIKQQSIVYEKPQSKFISRPRNNFRKR